jgi:hypothetical protein
MAEASRGSELHRRVRRDDIFLIIACRRTAATSARFGHRADMLDRAAAPIDRSKTPTAEAAVVP